MNPMLMPQAAFAMPMGVPEVPQGQMVQPAPADPQSYLKPASGIAKTLPKLKGFASSPYMAKGLGAASRAAFSGDWGNLLGGFADATAEYQAANQKATVLGGPDDAFEITTDPTTGEKTYKPVEAVQSYLKDKRDAEARVRLTPKAPDLKDVADLVGRAASFVQKGGDLAEARAFLVNSGVPAASIPAQLSPAYAAFGATVPQAQAQEVREAAQTYREKDGDRRFSETVQQHGIANGFRARAEGRTIAKGSRSSRPSAAKPLKGYQTNITSKAAYDRLPSGTKFIAPDGSKRIKP